MRTTSKLGVDRPHAPLPSLRHGSRRGSRVSSRERERYVRALGPRSRVELADRSGDGTDELGPFEWASVRDPDRGRSRGDVGRRRAGRERLQRSSRLVDVHHCLGLRVDDPHVAVARGDRGRSPPGGEPALDGSGRAVDRERAARRSAKGSSRLLRRAGSGRARSQRLRARARHLRSPRRACHGCAVRGEWQPAAQAPARDRGSRQPAEAVAARGPARARARPRAYGVRRRRPRAPRPACLSDRARASAAPAAARGVDADGRARAARRRARA